MLDKTEEIDSLIADFKDPEDGEEYRYAYADEHLNTWIALQIKTLRDQRGLKQSDLATLIGTQQPGVARLENVNYASWKIETLRKIARAFDVRLKISFETFGSLLDEDKSFNRQALQRPRFEDDPAFSEGTAELALGAEDSETPAGQLGNLTLRSTTKSVGTSVNRFLHAEATAA